VQENLKVGLGVKGVVSHNFGETYGLRPLLFILPEQTPFLYLKFKPKYYRIIKQTSTHRTVKYHDRTKCQANEAAATVD